MLVPSSLAVVLMALNAAPVASQDPIRLEDRLAAPLLYLSMTPAGDAAGSGPQPLDLKRALVDPELLSLFGLAADATRGGGTLRLLRSILTSASGEIELAMTGVEARAAASDLPLLAFHTRVAESGLATLRAVLAERAGARRQVAGVEVFGLATAGSPFEVALIGADLLASNHAATIDDLLAPRTAAMVVLASDPDYRRLRAEIEPAPGALTLYADWRRLAARLPGLFGGHDLGVLSWSGLATTRRVLLVLRPQPAGLVTSLLLQHDQQAGGPDGWLSLVDRLHGRDPTRDLPTAGVGALIVGLDPQRLLASPLGPRMARVLAGLSGGCQRLGVDLANQVLRPLGDTAAVQVLVVGDVRQAHLAYSLRAKSPAAARSLFGLCKAHFVRGGWGRVARTDGGEELALGGSPDEPEREGVLRMTVVQDALVFAFADGVLAQVRAESAPRRDRARLATTLRKLGAPRQGVAGVFCFDPAALLGRDDVTNPLLGRHAGYLQVEPGLLRLDALAEH